MMHLAGSLRFATARANATMPIPSLAKMVAAGKIFGKAEPENGIRAKEGLAMPAVMLASDAEIGSQRMLSSTAFAT
jgi:hypothetical protein